MKRAKTQITITRIETRVITTNPQLLKGCKTILQLYSHKFNNLGEMDQVLKNHKLLKLNQDEIGNLKSARTRKEIEVMIFKVSQERNLQSQMISLENSSKQLEN